MTTKLTKDSKRGTKKQVSASRGTRPSSRAKNLVSLVSLVVKNPSGEIANQRRRSALPAAATQARLVGERLLYRDVGMVTVSGAPEPRGERIKIDGRTMHVVRAGPKRGKLTVLLEAGSFGFSADWAVVQAQLTAKQIASIAYDRAGLAHSDPGPAPRDGLAIVSDLEKLLATLGEAGPFVVTGHSMAGLHIHLFAARNPDKVAGLVFVDAITPALATDPTAKRVAAQYVRFSRAAAWAAARGLLKPLSRWADQIGLTSDAAQHKRWAFADPGHNRAAADEVVQWETSVSQAAGAGALSPDWPVAVVLAGPVRAPPHQEAVRGEPARRSPHGHHERVVGANHASLIGKRHAQAVVRAIAHVRDAAMAKAS